MKTEIKYQIKDENATEDKLSEITMITEMDNPLNVTEALLILKDHYHQRFMNGGIKIKQQVDAWEKENNSKIEWEEREKLVLEFYGYDKESIKIISINELSFKQLDMIQHEIIYERLKTKLEWIAKNKS